MNDNQQRARDLLTAPHPGTDINPYWRVDMLAAALDAAEARGRAAMEARVQAAANQRAAEELDAVAEELLGFGDTAPSKQNVHLAAWLQATADNLRGASSHEQQP